MNLMYQTIIDYFQGSVAELRHVVWPQRRDVIRHTVVIIISVAIAMLIIAGLDYAFGQLVNHFILKA